MDESRRDDEEIQPTASASEGTNLVRTSRLAVAACVLAVVSLLLLPGLLHTFVVRHGRAPLLIHQVYQLVTFAVSISAIVLSLVSLAQISLSAGRLTGRGFAWLGVGLMAVQVFFLFLPVAARTRCVAFRMTCGTNLSGIGKAMLIYANDYEDGLPRAGGRNTRWTGRTPDWKAADRRVAFGLALDGTGGEASMTASLYLLVKYSEVTPKSFLCRSSRRASFGRVKDAPEPGMSVFDLSGLRGLPRGFELIDGWDFGPTPWLHCSYSYHVPYGLYGLTTSNEPGFAVAADRNPWMDSPSAKARDFLAFKPDVPPFNGTAEQAKQGNSPRHDNDGQNVLFLDSHVEFAKRAYCAIDDDNIYTISTNSTAGDFLGTPPTLGSQPANRKDSLLVNDPPSIPDEKRKRR